MTTTLTRVDIRPHDGVTGMLLRTDPYAVESAAEYVDAGGYRDVPDLLDRIDAADLRGRGGAHFPVRRKVAAVLDRPGPRVVVANGEEGEPASVKDRYLMLHRPHLVLDGLRLMTRVVDAQRAVVYVSDEAVERTLLAAIERDRGFLGRPGGRLPGRAHLRRRRGVGAGAGDRRGTRAADRETAASIRGGRRGCADAGPERRDPGSRRSARARRSCR